MKIVIGMIVLNEEEYLLKNLQQHYRHAHEIIIVEGADRLYPSDRVTKSGLSTDSTAEVITSFPDPAGKIKFVQHGWTKMGGPNAKCELRNRYLELITERSILIVIDADEFYLHKDLDAVIDTINKRKVLDAYQLPQIHFWKDTTRFVTGGYFDVPHTRFWVVQPGDRYTRDHNYPCRGDRALRNGIVRLKKRRVVKNGSGEMVKLPCCFHFGFVKKRTNMADKQKYYENRGEKRTRYRNFRCRNSWFSDQLHHGMACHNYDGPLPECFETPEPIACSNGLGQLAPQMANTAPSFAPNMRAA